MVARTMTLDARHGSHGPSELVRLQRENGELRAELAEAKEIGNRLIIEAVAKNAEIEKLRGEIDTCRELRKYDRIEVERMRILLDRKHDIR
jgi:hypothetical protein